MGYTSPKVFLVVVTYPDPDQKRARTETFDFENEASDLFHELHEQRNDDKTYNGVFMIELNRDDHSVWLKKLWKRPAD